MQSLIKQVKANIKEHQMFKKGERVAVAASGGKDSIALIRILKELGYEIVALSVDNGIESYSREDTENLKKVCDELNVELKVYSFKEIFGKGVDDLKLNNPCPICAAQIKRIISHKALALGFDKVVLGHNKDDRLNVPKKQGNVEIVMPMYNIPELDVMALGIPQVHCPYKNKYRELF